MPWTFTDKRGESRGAFSTAEEARRLAEKDPEFSAEVADSVLEYHDAGTGQVIQDSIPQHWNPAFPEPVRGKQQMKRLQKQFGTSDFEPKPETKERLDHFAKKAIHDASHRR